MLELFKEINSDVQELITLDILAEVSNPIEWSPASENSPKKKHFYIRGNPCLHHHFVDIRHQQIQVDNFCTQ